MEITLRDYMQLCNLNNMPLAKHQLLRYKKLGHLFFKEEVSELHLEAKFQLYYYLSANESSEKSAFPIPKQSFLLAKATSKGFDEMKNHFESYYLHEELDKEGFDEFDLKNPYVGEDYVWVFKRTS